MKANETLAWLGLQTASNIIEFDGVQFHFILHCTVEKNTCALWTFARYPRKYYLV